MPSIPQLPSIHIPGTKGLRAKQSRRREAVLGSLVDLFMDNGFLELSVDDMARHAHCSKRTIYLVGSSKEQVILTVIRGFFKRATSWIEERLDKDADPIEQIGQYLRLIAEALSPASVQFFRDLDAYEPAGRIYQQNTRIAADHVKDLVREAMGERNQVDSEFIGAVAGLVMNSIHRKEVEQATGLDDAAAYRALANLIVAGVRGGEDI
ncbi:TetR/AcrR family transcriptional regulator [Brevibacterium sp. 50QC2O2]|jgi:AcrR family transcriptional regulator|uniref:TetR/AcrR family transcriptional regulator n=1 Tax=Brevibacterium TaxID=1696 RepID=UPI00211C7A09|nr:MULTISPECIES: TetR/AcrR family transcriptional regulator [unclassified Brevibacterium]MCQ9386876.1 TetR/AcrR family transcriptional regulator [Brevibacterium sp. 68QC2CO]MCQ9389833.1 TetR/AcrR family transcriptional regulator [Brevibacterium sp. 50QC2O2]